MSKYTKSSYDDIIPLNKFIDTKETEHLPLLIKEEVETVDVPIPKPKIKLNRHMKDKGDDAIQNGIVNSLNSVKERVSIVDEDMIEIDHKFYMFEKEYTQVCRRTFSCNVPIYALELLTDSSYYNYYNDQERVDASNELDRRALTVVQIIEHVYDGVNIHIMKPEDIVTILQIVERALNIYVGDIPIHHDAFMIPSIWFEKFLYYRELVLANRPGLINKIESIVSDESVYKVNIPRGPR